MTAMDLLRDIATERDLHDPALPEIVQRWQEDAREYLGIIEKINREGQDTMRTLASFIPMEGRR